MSHFKKITDGTPLNSVSKWTRKSLQQGDHQNKNQSTFPKTVPKGKTNRVNRMISPTPKNITKTRSPSPGIITVEYRDDEYKCGDCGINRVDNTSVSINRLASATSAKLIYRKSPSEVKTKNECSNKKDQELIKTATRFSTYTQFAKQVEQTAIPDANIVKSEAFKTPELKENRTCSKAIKQKRMKLPVVSISRHSRKYKRHQPEPVRQHVKSTSQKHVIQDLGAQTMSVQNKGTEDLNTPTLDNQDISTEYHNIEGLNIQDQKIETNPTAEITFEQIVRSAFVNFVNGFILSFSISIVFLVLDFIALNLIE